MRLGDSITINEAEAELLRSRAFQKFASADVGRKVLIAPSEEGYYRLALPSVGKQIIAVLSAFAASDVQADQAITAEGLAVAIAQRISPGPTAS